MFSLPISIGRRNVFYGWNPFHGSLKSWWPKEGALVCDSRSEKKRIRRQMARTSIWPSWSFQLWKRIIWALDASMKGQFPPLPLLGLRLPNPQIQKHLETIKASFNLYIWAVILLRIILNYFNLSCPILWIEFQSPLKKAGKGVQSKYL